MTAPIKYKDGYRYQLDEAYSHVLINAFPAVEYEHAYLKLSGGVLTLNRGYASDGPSGPTIDTKNFMRGAFCHDGLYQLIRLGVLDKNKCRQLADKELYDMCREDGMSVLRASAVYYGVRIGGNSAAMPNAEHPVLVAP